MKKHSLLMLICCLVPLGILITLLALGLSSPYVFLGVILLCPLSHLLMMWGAGKDGGHAH